MKVGRNQRGFTIVETMIVLAVTGALFVAAAITISGRHAHAQFEQSAQDIRSRIQQTLNEVATGHYPNIGGLTCSAGALGPVFATAGSAEQGENAGCIFLGKALQFDIAGSDPEKFRTYTIGGLQQTSSGAEVATYAEARPLVAAPSTANPLVPDSSDTGTLLYGLTSVEAYYGTPKTAIGAVAFVNSLADYDGSAILSGAQQVNVIPIDGSALNVSSPQAAQIINSRLATSPVNPATGVKICFLSPGTEQSALITIGGQGRQLSVTLDIKGNTTCS